MYRTRKWFVSLSPGLTRSLNQARRKCVPFSIRLTTAEMGCRVLLCGPMLCVLAGVPRLMCGGTMKVKYWAIVLMLAGLTLYGVQALVWRSGSRGRTETDVENRTGHHRATESPVIAGTALLLLAGAILVIPRHKNRPQ
jgi:hypothetical protein